MANYDVTNSELKDLNVDYSTKEDREATISFLFSHSKNEREYFECLWETYDNFYQGHHSLVQSINEEFGNISNNSLNEKTSEDYYSNYIEPILTDPFIAIESQLDPSVPEFEFIGRSKTDYKKVKQRKYIVDYVMSINDFKSQNTKLDRTLKKYGDAFVKVFYNNSMKNEKGFYNGEICLDVVNLDDIYPDPTANCLEECEYINYAYKMNIRKAMRVFKKDFKKAKIDKYSIASSSFDENKPISENNNFTENEQFEVEILEHWYKDDEGDIACSMLVDGKEFKFIEKYWENTKEQNKQFPFIHFYRILDERRFWNISELKAILPLVQANDNILRTALTNMEMVSNDIIIAEEDALVDGQEITNEPGEIINVKAGRINDVRRLSGLNSLKDFIPDIQFIQQQIQKTLRNYDTNLGAESTRVTTASGIAQLRADSQSQHNIKEADKFNAFKRLALLIDWSALEFYNEDKMIFIGVPKKEKTNLIEDFRDNENLDPTINDIFFTFNSDNIKEKDENVLIEEETGEIIEENEKYYFPLVDCDINASNAIEKSKAFTIQTIKGLVDAHIDEENYKLSILMLKELNIPHTEEIVEYWENKFSPKMQFSEEIETAMSGLDIETQELLRKNPQLVQQAMEEAGSGIGGGINPAQNAETSNSTNNRSQYTPVLRLGDTIAGNA